MGGLDRIGDTSSSDVSALSTASSAADGKGRVVGCTVCVCVCVCVCVLCVVSVCVVSVCVCVCCECVQIL